MGAGRRAAKAIGSYLSSGKTNWPVSLADADSFDANKLFAPSSADGKACPKCHRPLEDDGEAYICCADARLEWRCTKCHKVAEGFAFPYGLCPYCSGKLEALGERTFEGSAALEGIRTAFEIELGGQAFYSRAAALTADPVLKTLFGKFAAMENEHMGTLSRRYHVAIPKASAEFRIDLAAINAGIDGTPDDPASLFRLAIAFEQRAVDFFVGRAAAEKDGSAAQVLYRELAAEEREHAALLATEFDRWKAGKGGLL